MKNISSPCSKQSIQYFSDDQVLPRSTTDGSAMPDIGRACIERILKFSFLEALDDSFRERVESAQRITKILMSHADELDNLPVLHVRTKSRAG